MIVNSDDANLLIQQRNRMYTIPFLTDKSVYIYNGLAGCISLMFMQFWQLELFTNFYRYAMPYTIFYVNSENAVKSVRQRIMPNMCINFLIELLLAWRLPDFSSHLNLL